MSLSDTFPGLRVLDLATNLAGPFAAMILGDLGADVIKVERSPSGDDTRSLPPFADGQATVFTSVNRNKRSIMIDYKSRTERDLLLGLVSTADVVIESFPPGIAERWQLTWDDLSQVNPRLIMASVSAFGDGPVGRTMPGYDALVQAVSGLMSFTGNPGEPTVRIAPSALDLTTGNWTAMAIMAALVRRQASGRGEHIATALIDTAFNLMNHQLLSFHATGKEPEKLGSGTPSAAPYGVYRARDGEILIATASEDQFPRLCDALGLAGIKDDTRFGTMAGRTANREPLDRLIADVVGAKSVSDTLAILHAARISAGRVNTVAQACALPVAQERGLLNFASGASVPQISLPLAGPGDRQFRAPPSLDEHRAEILQEVGLAEVEQPHSRTP